MDQAGQLEAGPQIDRRANQAVEIAADCDRFGAHHPGRMANVVDDAPESPPEERVAQIEGVKDDPDEPSTLSDRHERAIVDVSPERVRA